MGIGMKETIYQKPFTKNYLLKTIYLKSATRTYLLETIYQKPSTKNYVRLSARNHLLENQTDGATP